jgi:hypothetical protein
MKTADAVIVVVILVSLTTLLVAGDDTCVKAPKLTWSEISQMKLFFCGRQAAAIHPPAELRAMMSEWRTYTWLVLTAHTYVENL